MSNNQKTLLETASKSALGQILFVALVYGIFSLLLMAVAYGAHRIDSLIETENAHDERGRILLDKKAGTWEEPCACRSITGWLHAGADG